MLDRAIDKTQLSVGIAGIRERLRQLGGQLEIRSSSTGTRGYRCSAATQESQPVLDQQIAAFS